MYPVSALYVGLHALLLRALAMHVVYWRARLRIPFGDGGNERLLRAIHGNFAEHAPMVLLQRAARATLLVAGGLVTAGRVLHAAGLSRSGAPSVPRAVGSLLTWVFLLVGGPWCAARMVAR